MDLQRLFDLEHHGPDTYVGIGPKYPWGGLYGGQIVAQALRAAASTVDPEGGVEPHSLRAYFIRRGEHTEPVRYEVDRIRNGRSFSTRRVVARQAVGAILNLEASFQKAEQSDDVQSVEMDENLPLPDGLDATTTWTPSFERRFVPEGAVDQTRRTGTGRVAAWTKVNVPVGDEQLVHRCWLAYLSDDFPFDAVRGAVSFPEQHGGGNASLDHTIWFHRPVRADEWLLHDFTCHGYAGGRGLAIGHVFTTAGLHVATVAQEALYRAPRSEG